MSIEECLPDAFEYITNEFKTLEYLQGIIQERFHSLMKDAYNYYSNYYYKLKKNSKKPSAQSFNFESKFKIKIDGRDGVAYIGAHIIARVKKKCKEITYYFAVTEKVGESEKLLRKFHFDFSPQVKEEDKKEKDTKHLHPVFHLQYAGKLSEKLSNAGCDAGPLDPWLSEPRIIYYPMSLALLINMVLTGFPDDINRKLVETSEWRDLIRKNEKLVLEPFFQQCRDFLSSQDSELFTNDFCYGN